MKLHNTILIPNATSPKNLGDHIMLFTLISMLQKSMPTVEIRLHSFDHHLQHYDKISAIKPTLYSWSVFEVHSFVLRVSRLMRVLLAMLFPMISTGYVKTLIKDYCDADIIIFAPGGYLRSRTGIKQSLNVCMQLIPFWIAFRLKKKTLGAPMSVGPFASVWQERLVVRALAHVNTLFTREYISRDLLKKYGVESVLGIDMSLYRSVHPTKYTKKHTIIGLIVRDWGYAAQKEVALEQTIVQTIIRLSNEQKIVIQPFVHVDAPEYGDVDRQVLERIIKMLKEKGCSVLPLISPKTHQEAEYAYKQVTILLTMRLHASLLSARYAIPSVLISDEHKSLGIFTDLHMQTYVADPCTLTGSELYKKISYILQHYESVQQILNNRTHELSKRRETFVSLLQKEMSST